MCMYIYICTYIFTYICIYAHLYLLAIRRVGRFRRGSGVRPSTARVECAAVDVGDGHANLAQHPHPVNRRGECEYGRVGYVWICRRCW